MKLSPTNSLRWEREQSQNQNPLFRNETAKTLKNLLKSLKKREKSLEKERKTYEKLPENGVQEREINRKLQQIPENVECKKQVCTANSCIGSSQTMAVFKNFIQSHFPVQT